MSQRNWTSMVHEYMLDEDETPSAAVISAAAAVEGRSPLDLTPLAEVVDPDALDTLLTTDAGTGQYSFEYCGYEVMATPDEVRVKEPTNG